MNIRLIACAGAALALHAAPARSAPHWIEQTSGVEQRLRAVSAVSAQVAWASGAGGTVLRTLNGGRTWTLVRIPDAQALDFRDIEAFDAHTAYVLSVGSGESSRIYKTEDGGAHWTLQFVNPQPAGFYDAFAFWDRDRGLAFGDPVDGRYTVIYTRNGGREWLRAPAEGLPPALPGESAFAASGDCLIAGEDSNAWFATGGAQQARVFSTRDGGLSWSATPTPLIAGRDSAGVFALAFADALHGVAVGGDYREESARNANLAHSLDGGGTWTSIGGVQLPGFRSSVAFLPGSRGVGVIALGPSGSDLSLDGGKTWTPLRGGGAHALSLTGKTRTRAVWAVGENGRILKLSFETEELLPPEASSAGR